MAGILDNKTRVMDVVVTAEGKRQIGTGDFKVAYATFTDRSAFYDKSSISGSSDSSMERPYIEATSFIIDTITIEKDDNGAVIPFASVIDSSGDRVNSKSGTLTKNGEPAGKTNKKDNQQIIDAILAGTINNFKKQMIIASKDPLDDSDIFRLSDNTIAFNYGNRGPIVGSELVSTIDQAASVFTDKRFANAVNFMFMPPIAKTSQGDVTLGQYTDVRQVDEYTYEDVIDDVIGDVPDQPVCPFKEIEFTETSITNDICIQAFEMGQYLRKLDMVDFGEYYVASDTNPSKHVVFLGKNYIDSYGATNFANIFTIILE